MVQGSELQNADLVVAQVPAEREKTTIYKTAIKTQYLNPHIFMD